MPLTRPGCIAALAALALLLAAGSGEAAGLGKPKGWRVLPTKHAYAALLTRLEAAVKAAGMNIVNAASASDGAAQQGFKIAGNRVVGVYRNDFARRMLAASLAAGIEAPIRIYVTENADGTATLSYKPPSLVFAPYFKEGGKDLRAVATELDPIFARIVDEAAKD